MRRNAAKKIQKVALSYIWKRNVVKPVSPLKHLSPLKNIPFFNNKKVVFSGFRNKDYEKIIESNNGKVMGNVSKNTDLLVIKDKDEYGEKVKKAIAMNIKIITKERLEEIIKHSLSSASSASSVSSPSSSSVSRSASHASPGSSSTSVSATSYNHSADKFSSVDSDDFYGESPSSETSDDGPLKRYTSSEMYKFFYNKTVVFVGFENKEYEKIIEANNGIMKRKIAEKIDIFVVIDKKVRNHDILKVIELNSVIISKAELEQVLYIIKTAKDAK